MIYTPVSTRYPELQMLEKAHQRTAESIAQAADEVYRERGYATGYRTRRIGDSVAMTATGTEYITEYPCKILNH